jgi:hypothetical protein
MSTRPTLQTEPAALTTAITAAVVATINVLGIILGWSADVIAGLNIAAAAWVGVLGFWLRRVVTPVATAPEADPPEFA